jgi:Uma2 family endonuclease
MAQVQTPASLPPGEVVKTADQRVILHGVPWSHYEVLLALRGEASVPRLTYLEGELELMTPSQDHERIKTLVARLLEVFALVKALPLNGYGSWTLKSAPGERGVEPDECYVLGDPHGRDRPDLAIEVMWTSGSLDKLAVYAGLGVGEVWFWREGRIEVHVRRGGGYTRVERSSLLPDLDLELLARFLADEDQTRAARDYLAALGGGEGRLPLRGDTR